MTDFELEDAPCPHGCRADARLLFVARNRLNDGQHRFSLVRCGECGLIRTSPRPTKSSIGFFYPDNYGPFRRDEELPFSADGLPLALRRPLDMLWQRASGVLLPRVNPGRALEIGCGTGILLDQLTRRGWQVVGVENAPFAAEKARARGHQVVIGDIENIDMPPNGPFDLLVAMHVVEHLHDPVATLQKLARWMRDDGRAIIVAPDAGALGWRLHTDRWQPVEAPRHLFHFTKPSLARLLKASGWAVDRQTTQLISNSVLQSGAYWANDKGWYKLARRLSDVADNKSARTLRRALAVLLGLAGQSGVQIALARKS